MSLETLLFLQRLLHGQQLTVGAPDFPETAHAVVVALLELETAIAAAHADTTTDAPAP